MSCAGCIAIGDELVSVDSTPVTSISKVGIHFMENQMRAFSDESSCSWQVSGLLLGLRGKVVTLGLKANSLGNQEEVISVSLLRTESISMSTFVEGGAGLVVTEGLDGFSTVIEKVVNNRFQVNESNS